LDASSKAMAGTADDLVPARRKNARIWATSTGSARIERVVGEPEG
jgi:hypothetical protein